jgi:hypothetical protein
MPVSGMPPPVAGLASALPASPLCVRELVAHTMAARREEFFPKRVLKLPSITAIQRPCSLSEGDTVAFFRLLLRSAAIYTGRRRGS